MQGEKLFVFVFVVCLLTDESEAAKTLRGDPEKIIYLNTYYTKAKGMNDTHFQCLQLVYHCIMALFYCQFYYSVLSVLSHFCYLSSVHIFVSLLQYISVSKLRTFWWLWPC